MRAFATASLLLAAFALAAPSSHPKRQSAPTNFAMVGCVAEASSATGFNYLTPIELVSSINDCATHCETIPYPEPLMTFHYTVSR